MKRVGRTSTTGSPDHNSICSASRARGGIENVHLIDGHLREIDKRFDTVVPGNDGNVSRSFEVGKSTVRFWSLVQPGASDRSTAPLMAVSESASQCLLHPSAAFAARTPRQLPRATRCLRRSEEVRTQPYRH